MNQFDGQEIYCRKLGHHLKFSYCRAENLGQPCSKMISCWGHRIELSKFINTHFPDFAKDQDLVQVKPKIASILDIVNQVKSNQRNTAEDAE